MQTSSLKLRSIAIGMMAFAFALISHPAHALGTVTHLTATPTVISISSDDTVALTVTAYDADGKTADVTGIATYATNDPRGSFTGATYHAGKVGSWSVSIKAEGQTLNIPATITVGKLSEIVINPNSAPERVPLNTTRQFSVTGFDQHNNPVTIGAKTWAITNSLGTVSSAGLFSAKKVGDGTLSVTSAGINGSVTVTVFEKAAVTLGPIVNTNSSTNTNSATNANSNSNTKISSNTNSSTDNASTTRVCSSARNWLWGLILLALLGGSALLYAFIPVTKIWPAAISLVLAAILSVIERKTGCNGTMWWPWVATLGSAALAALAYQQAPKTINQQ